MLVGVVDNRVNRFVLQSHGLVRRLQQDGKRYGVREDAILSRRQVHDFSGRPVDDAALELVLAVASAGAIVAQSPTLGLRRSKRPGTRRARLSKVWRSAGWIAGSAATIALVVLD